MISDYDKQLAHIYGTWNRLRFMIWRHLSVLHQEPVLCRLVLMELRSDLDDLGLRQAAGAYLRHLESPALHDLAPSVGAASGAGAVPARADGIALRSR